MQLNRVTEGISFNTGITGSDWSSGVVGQSKGSVQEALLPGSTTVSQALKDIFPTSETIANLIMAKLAAEGGNPALRTANGFHFAAQKALKSLRERAKGGEGSKSSAMGRAADEIEQLLADAELLDEYRNSLMET